MRAVTRWPGLGLSAGVCLALWVTMAGAGEPTASGPRADTVSVSEVGQLRRLADRALQKQPAPLAVVHTEGTLPTTSAYQQANQAKKDWSDILTLASAYANEPEPNSAQAQAYLDGYARYQSAWLHAYIISGNPIDETDLGHWLLAFHAAGRALAPDLQRKVRSFACQLALSHMKPTQASKATSRNNWQSHRAKLAVMGAYVCGQASLVEQAIGVFEAQVRQNLLATGEPIDFAQRDALHYAVYSLEPLLMAALFSELQGKSIYAYTGPQGQSIGRSLKWLAPYARGEIEHMEFVHSTVRFDAERAAAGVKGFSGLFKPEVARHTYWLASQLDAQWHTLSATLGVTGVIHRAAWLAR